MKNNLLIILIALLSYSNYAQINYEKGYFIDNEGNKTECLIKNIDWKNNPSEFKYKLSENSNPKTATIKTVKEFGVIDQSKFIRATVAIDRSSDAHIRSFSSEKKPIFKDESLFLNLLIKGKVNLYYFEDGNLRRFFYKTGNSKITQLIYKRYIIKDTQIGINNTYKQQLITILNCDLLSKKSIEKSAYKKKNLVLLFSKNNNCGNSSPTTLLKAKKTKLNFRLNLAIQSSSLKIHNDLLRFKNANFGNKIGLKIGAEIEAIFPFNKNKWSILIAPSYQNFNAENELNTRKVSVSYSSIEVPVGIRHYFFFNNKSKIFINGFYIFDFSFNSIIDFEPGSNLEINNSTNIALGLGYSYNDRLSLEFRHGFKRDILNLYFSWSGNYPSSSIILGYTLF